MNKSVAVIIFCLLMNPAVLAEPIPSSCPPKIIIGAAEPIVLLSSPPIRLTARMDTGATLASIDTDLALKLGFRHAIGQVSISNAHGTRLRKVVRIPFLIRGQKREAEFTLTKRSHLDYPILLGRSSLKGFLIDPDLSP